MTKKINDRKRTKINHVREQSEHSRRQHFFCVAAVFLHTSMLFAHLPDVHDGLGSVLISRR
jgi:hypothetical protein